MHKYTTERIFMQAKAVFCKTFGAFSLSSGVSEKTAAVLKKSAAVLKKTAAVLKKSAAVLSAYLCKPLHPGFIRQPSAIRQLVNACRPGANADY